MLKLHFESKLLPVKKKMVMELVAFLEQRTLTVCRNH